jgi:hypothetical protein
MFGAGQNREETMIAEAAPDRTLWQLTGADALPFLQGLVSNDVRPLGDAPGIVWCALLSPQGKYLADFFVVHPPAGGLLIDIATPLAEATLRRLSMYRLRAEVTIAPSPLQVTRGLGAPPPGTLADPRHPALGWRAYGDDRGAPPSVDWTALRIEHLIPESGIELIPDETYPLEAGFERLGGVDFRKGCYVGQEVTARMKHKTELRKGLVRLAIEGEAPPGTPILSDGKPAGTLHSAAAGRALAHMRLDRLEGTLTAGPACLRAESP